MSENVLLQKLKPVCFRRTGLIFLVALFFSVFSPAHAGREEKARLTVTEAAESVRYFTEDRNYRQLWNLANDAEAMIVIPRSVKAGFVFGGSGGNGVMLARGKDGQWSQPTFLRISSFSFGLQAGAEVSEIVLLVMTRRGVDQLLGSSVKLGADISVAAGPLGGGGKAQTTDILAFSRGQGLYGGVSVEGGVLKVNHKWNKAYYGKKVSPTDAIYLGKARNGHSNPLRNAVTALAAKRDD